MNYLKNFLLVVIIPFAISSAQTNEGWIEDIDFLFDELEIRHADLYHTISKDSLEFLVDELKLNLGKYTDNEIMFRLGRTLVNINDGHTGIFFPYADELKLHRLPLHLRSVDDGIVVMNSLPEYKELIGKKLIEINGRKISDLLPELYKFIPRDNKFGPEGDGGDYIAIAEMLEHLGVKPKIDFYDCTFENKSGVKTGKKIKILSNEDFDQYEKPDTMFNSIKWLNPNGQKFWKELIDDDILYIQLNSSDIGGLEREIVKFSDEIVSISGKSSVNKIVLDLRENHGGSISKTIPLLKAIITIDKSYPEKKLFVLTSKNTFSAASVLAVNLKYYTDAIFVGSPMAGKPGSVGDIGWIILPNSQVRIRYSRLQGNQPDAWNASPTIFPDFKAPIKYEHLVNGIDPAIDIIKNYQPKKDFSESVENYLDPPVIERVIEIYRDYKDNRYNGFVFNVHVLNSMGVKLYKAEQKDAALKLLGLNTEEYPWSPLAHSNFGQLLIELGEKDRGMQHLKKAFYLHKGYSAWRDLINKQKLD